MSQSAAASEEMPEGLDDAESAIARLSRAALRIAEETRTGQAQTEALAEKITELTKLITAQGERIDQLTDRLDTVDQQADGHDVLENKLIEIADRAVARFDDKLSQSSLAQIACLRMQESRVRLMAQLSAESIHRAAGEIRGIASHSVQQPTDHVPDRSPNDVEGAPGAEHVLAQSQLYHDEFAADFQAALAEQLALIEPTIVQTIARLLARQDPEAID